MNFRINRLAAGVLCALAETAVADQGVNGDDVLDPLQVSAPAAEPAAGVSLDTVFGSPARESADLLRDVPGVSGSRMGGHGTDPTIRGQTQTQLNVLLDGAYIHGGCPNRMDPPTSYAPIGSYEEITVIKGVQTLEYGGGGAGGTVLFERRTERFGDAEPLRAELEAGYRGNGDSWDVIGDVTAGNSTGFARVIASRVEAGNYADGDGNDVRSSYRETAGSFIAGYTPDADTRVELGADVQRTRDILFPGAGMDSPKADNDTLRFRYLGENLPGALDRVKVALYRSDVAHVMDNYTLRTNTGPDVRAPSTSLTTGGRVVSQVESRVGRWKIGADFQYNDRVADRFVDSLGGVRQSLLWPDVEIDQKGLFAELTHELAADRRLTGGVRYDRVESEANDAAVTAMGGVSPNTLYGIYYGVSARKRAENNVGGLLRLEQDFAGRRGMLYAALSRAVRTADATERFMAANSSDFAARWVGNPDIAPEKHHQVEVGVQLAGERWNADAAVYYNAVSDFILRDRFHVTGNNATIYRNIDATLVGGEANIAWRPARAWLATAGVAYVWANNDTDDRPIAQTPPLEGTLSLEYQEDAWQAGGRVRAAATQDRVDLDPAVGSGLDVQKTPAWAVLDLYASYMLNANFSIDAGVDNLLDRDYAQHLNRANALDATQVQVDEPGRSAWVRVRATF